MQTPFFPTSLSREVTQCVRTDGSPPTRRRILTFPMSLPLERKHYWIISLYIVKDNILAFLWSHWFLGATPPPLCVLREKCGLHDRMHTHDLSEMRLYKIVLLRRSRNHLPSHCGAQLRRFISSSTQSLMATVPLIFTRWIHTVELCLSCQYVLGIAVRVSLLNVLTGP